MAEKMMRIAGRSDSGQAKALKTDEAGNLIIKPLTNNIVLVSNEQIIGQPNFEADLTQDVAITRLSGTWVQDKTQAIIKAYAAGENLAYFTSLGQKADLEYEIKSKSLITVGDYMAPAWRIVNATNYYSIHPTTGGNGELRKFINGVKTVLRAGSFPINPMTSVTYRIKMIGSLIEVYANGELWATASDTSHLSGYLGAIAYSNGGKESIITSLTNFDPAATEPFREVNVNAFGLWTLFLSASKATELTIELSTDELHWFRLPENPLVFNLAEDKIIEIGYLTKAVRIKSNNDAFITAHIFGAVYE